MNYLERSSDGSRLEVIEARVEGNRAMALVDGRPEVRRGESMTLVLDAIPRAFTVTGSGEQTKTFWAVNRTWIYGALA